MGITLVWRQAERPDERSAPPEEADALGVGGSPSVSASLAEAEGITDRMNIKICPTRYKKENRTNETAT